MLTLDFLNLFYSIQLEFRRRQYRPNQREQFDIGVTFCFNILACWREMLKLKKLADIVFDKISK
jgi:hypothetical protein